MTEHVLQLDCIASFRNAYERFNKGKVIPVPNELAAKRKDIEVCIGASDLITVLENKVRFNELKVGYNTQSDAQEDFEKVVVSLGFEYNLIRSVEQFNKIHGITT